MISPSPAAAKWLMVSSVMMAVILCLLVLFAGLSIYWLFVLPIAASSITSTVLFVRAKTKQQPTV